MADETRIDPDGAKRMFRVLGEIGADIDAALHRVHDIRETVVRPWGADDYGRPFEGDRETMAKNTLEGLGFVAEGLSDLSEVGGEAVEEFVKADINNGKGL